MVLAKQRIDKFGFDIIESSQVSLEDAVRQKEGCKVIGNVKLHKVPSTIMISTEHINGVLISL